MADVFTPEKRRWIMARVTSSDTKPELVVRSLVHRLGFRFRLHAADLPGKPDLVLPRHGKVIFVHGCFWHQHANCERAQRPTSNVLFWNKKLDGNTSRDRRNLAKLRRLGWKALVIWECQTTSASRLERILTRFLF